MVRAFLVLVFLFLLGIQNSKAYEFMELNKLYDLLENNHTASTNFKDISIKGALSLNNFDKDFRLFNSDTKAYLYHKNNLIKVIDLPTENESSELWKKVLQDVLSLYNRYSSKDVTDKQNLEALIMKNITANIDKNSRIESAKIKKEKYYVNIENNIIHFRTNVFYKGLSDDIKRIVLENKNTEGLILDLRNNKGGCFDEAVKVSDLFLDNLLIAYSVENGKTNYYNSSKGDILRGKQIVVLVNNKTASAAEIVTAALGEQSRATIMGTKTYGKGSIQSVYHIKNNDLYITSGLAYTPSGKMIDKQGIVPQICTGISNSCQTTSTKDTQKELKLAIEVIKNSLG